MCYNFLLRKNPALKEYSINYITNLQKLACKKYSSLNHGLSEVFCRNSQIKNKYRASNALIILKKENDLARWVRGSKISGI